MDSLGWPTYLLFLPAGLLLPGWLLSRVLGSPTGWTGAFLGSCALQFNLVLLLNALGIALTLLHVVAAWGALCLVLLIVARRRSPQRSAAAEPLASHPADVVPWWHWAPAAAGLAAITVKACVDPLSGLDTKFRWDFLAQQIVARGNLDFYPPLRAEDFLAYSWCDGIAPLVSTLYAWIYQTAGTVNPTLTAPVVVVQAVLLFAGVYQLAATRWGRRAGAFATALLAASATLLSGVAMGQETGLTALSLVAVFGFIDRHRHTGRNAFLVWAGVAAGVGALAREYALIYVALGALAVWPLRISGRGWIAYLGAFAAVAAPWYLRNWIRTDNPLYSHDLAGLFTVNPVHIEYLRHVADIFSPWSDPKALGQLAQFVLLLAGVPLVLGALGMARSGAANRPLVIALGIVVLLWAWSVSQTSGRYAYSTRVLTPAVAMAAVLGGGWVAARGRQVQGIGVVILSIVASDAAMRSLYMPLEPKIAWWTQEPSAWREHRKRADWWDGHPYWRSVPEAAGHHMILTTDPFAYSLFRRNGGRPIPLFTPAVRFLFEGTPRFQEAVARLRTAGLRFIIIPRGDPVMEALLSRHAFFVELVRTAPTHDLIIGAVYDLYAPRYLPASPAAGSQP